MYWLTKLREFKKETGVTYKEISNRTGIPLTTVEKIFSGRTNDPKLTMVTDISAVLGHSVNELIPNSTNNTLTDYESQTLSRLRELDSFGRVRVEETIKSELCRVRAERNSVQHFTRIYYDFPVSAGTGEYLDNRTAVIANLSEEPPCGTDYILRISGNSMEPVYHDGDFIYVNSRDTVEFGEIGIFIAEGSVYMKEYTPQGLKSLNPDYALIKFYDDVRCLGKVIGRLKGSIETTTT